MNVENIPALATALSQARTSDAVQTAVLRKSLDLEQQSAQQMIQALEQSVPSNPPHLGNSVDVHA